MSVRRLILVSSIASLMFAVSCATIPYQPYAREVKKRPQEGGVIALNGVHRPEDRARAEILMSSNCSSGVPKVVEEGEIVVGEKTDSTARRTNDQYDNSAPVTIGGLRFGSSTPAENTAVTTHTTQVKEWQITYQCVAAVNPNTDPVARKATKSKKAKN